jgi:hypothetical protein
MHAFGGLVKSLLGGKMGVMWTRAVGLLVVAVVLGSGAPARAEEPMLAPPATSAQGPVPCAPAPVVDVVAEQRAFDQELLLFARRWEFTRRLVEEREARAFEEAAARHARFYELTRKLAAEAAAEAERQFESAVALYVKKRELTRSLAGAPKAAEPVDHSAPTR